MDVSVEAIAVSYQSYKNYVYIVFDSETGDGVLIDPAFDSDEIKSRVSRSNVNIRAVLITHHHPDHTDLAGSLSMHYRAPVIISAKAVEKAAITNYFSLQLIEQEMQLKAGSLSINPVFTPGHTAGCTCYIIGDCLFSGDAVFIEGCGVCLDDDSDPRMLFRSIRRLKDLLSPGTKIYPGHTFRYEPGKTYSFLLRKNLYFHVNLDDFLSLRMKAVGSNLLDFY